MQPARPFRALRSPSQIARPALQRSAKTDEEGRFNFPQLKPGTYSVRVEAEGFDPQQNDNVVSGLGQKQTVNFTLKVAQSNQTVEVSSASSPHQSRKRKHIHESECAGAGEPSQSGRRFNLPSSVCRRRARSTRQAAAMISSAERTGTAMSSSMDCPLSQTAISLMAWKRTTR